MNVSLKVFAELHRVVVKAAPVLKELGAGINIQAVAIGTSLPIALVGPGLSYFELVQDLGYGWLWHGV